jgi:hypothetical protein
MSDAEAEDAAATLKALYVDVLRLTTQELERQRQIP